MKLSVRKRSAKQKSELTTIRRNGDVPAVLYSKGKDGQALAVDGREFDTARRSIPSGHLPTTQFELHDADGSVRKAVVKAIDYHPTTYQVLHLDLMELHAGAEVNVKVPIVLTGVADCVGVKVGGVPRQVIRHLLVRCKPEHIPACLELDIRTLALKQSKRLSEIELPATVTPLVDMDEVAIVIAKR
ncbi:MAG: 50S ribosomal protein L25 [Chlamydiia bacterium]|nr:50S ribosomal protein L25 [Chlamydiia bacterium]